MLGVEGTLADGGECPDDDVNPNYPTNQVDYQIADQSIWDDAADLTRVWAFFGRDEGCASASPDELNNTCHEDFLAQIDLEDGDFFYIDLKIPLVRNPNVELAELKWYYTKPNRIFVPLRRYKNGNSWYM